MPALSGWSLVTTVSNILSIVTWVFPLLSLTILSYCIEFYTRFKTRWKHFLLASALALTYPIVTSYYYWVFGDTIPQMELFASSILLIGLLIASYASLQLLTFQKISLGKTKITIQALVTASVAIPLSAGMAGIVDYPTALYLTAYNLAASAMIFVFLSIGKLTQDYIPRYQLLAYTSARVASILLTIDPILLNYIYYSSVNLGLKYGLRLVGSVIQFFALILLTVPVVMLIMEAQARGVHLIPLTEKKDKKPMKYRLKSAYSYLIMEETPTHSTEIFTEYVTHKYHGLMFTRTQPSRIKQTYGLTTTPILWMTNAKTDEKSVKPNDLDRLVFVIKDFIRYETDCIVLLQRLDYLITENDFNTVLKFLHNLNDLIMSSKCILLVSVDPSTLTKERQAMLMQELEDLTNAEKISLGEPLYSVLLYVHTENKRRKTPSFKSITKKFQITKTTARKRIYELENKGLLKILSEGRYKFLEVTEKGRTVVGSPASIREEEAQEVDGNEE